MFWIVQLPLRIDVKIKELRTKISEPVVKRIPLWISANDLSMARCLSFVFILPPIMLGHYLLAFSVFLLASFLDFLDGELARFRHQETDLGRALDPVGDKLVFLSALIALVYMVEPETISRRLMWLLIGFELGSASLALVRKAISYIWEIEVPLGSNRFGQWKFACEATGVLVLLLNPGNFTFQLVASYFLKVALVLLILSIICHVLLAVKNINSHRQKQRKGRST